MIVGSLGFFAPVKGFDLLVSAFARVAGQHPGALLLIAGGDVMADTAYRRKLEKLVDGLRLSDRIRLLGGVNPKEGFLSALDIFVVASRTEGFSLSLVQAMQHGLPSVVTSAGGCREAARPDHESLVFASGNVDKLADNLDRMLRDDSLRQTFAESSRQRADSYLTMSRCAADYDAFYAEALPARS
jgi:glycosyltransferase involved in cell wall biosynthesis